MKNCKIFLSRVYFFLLLASEELMTLQVSEKEAKQPVKKPWCKALSAKVILVAVFWKGFAIANAGRARGFILF